MRASSYCCCCCFYRCSCESPDRCSTRPLSRGRASGERDVDQFLLDGQFSCAHARRSSKENKFVSTANKFGNIFRVFSRLSTATVLYRVRIISGRSYIHGIRFDFDDFLCTIFFALFESLEMERADLLTPCARLTDASSVSDLDLACLLRLTGAAARSGT